MLTFDPVVLMLPGNMADGVVRAEAGVPLAADLAVAALVMVAVLTPVAFGFSGGEKVGHVSTIIIIIGAWSL